MKHGRCVLFAVASLLLAGFMVITNTDLTHSIITAERTRSDTHASMVQHVNDGLRERQRDTGAIYERQRDTSAIYEQRRDDVRRVCAQRYANVTFGGKFNYRTQTYADDAHRIAYCAIPKVASTSWKRILLAVNTAAASPRDDVIVNAERLDRMAGFNVHRRVMTTGVLRQLYTLDARAESDVMYDYKKLIFVRHPFSRLLSAYRDKLDHDDDIGKFEKHRRAIAANAGRAVADGDDRRVTFREFLQYLVDSEPRLFNEHWALFAHLCSPCVADYHFVGKYENMEKESGDFLAAAGIDGAVKLSGKYLFVSHNDTSAEKLLMRYYGALPRELVAKVYETYRPDFLMFGYKVPEFLSAG
ncbi:PREDICTED: carbohydrate sulfotransferase 11-like [Priapulus caudatus]|uniref:Carbohydrate sulfotransferase n=1 Tax=Priapulus caudatus TaxID=37621 RepID=A0ABM1EAP8_PRICU|nr:PREDICTED: carbohydrate sulfotransferase 11-like [Priapulus caudatus]